MNRHGPRALMSAFSLAVALAACTQGAATTTTPTTRPTAAAQASSGAQPTTALMGAGTFHDVDGTASGQAQLVVLPSGAYEVVLEEFKTASVAHTNVVLVANADVTRSSDVDPSKILDLGPLKATEGMQDYPIPAEMASSVMGSYHAVVLWDTAMAHAVAAAPLQ